MLILAILVLLIWLYLLFFHAGFWITHRFVLPAVLTSGRPTVAAVIPARNEAELIGRTVTSLLRQDFTGDLRLFVVDDGSTDGTANAAREAAATLASIEKLTILRGQPLPSGWTGKVWAMQQGWQAAEQLKPDYVLFTDADIEHSPSNLAQLIAQAERGPYDLVSLMVRLRCESLPEKFLIPAFVYFFFLLYPPAKIRDTRSSVAGAAGGCILVRHEILEKIGGMECIRGEIIDDCALAAKIKKFGGRLWLGVTQDTRSIRRYESLANIRDMIARTAFNQLRHSFLLLAGCLAAIVLTFVVPLLLVWSNNAIVGWIAMIACVLMFASYVPTLRLYSVNVFSAFTLPFAAIFYMYATALSAWNYVRGRGGEWKGRAQDRAA